MAGSHGRFIFRSLKKLHTVFHNICTSLNSHQQRVWVPFTFFFFNFWMLSILWGEAKPYSGLNLRFSNGYHELVFVCLLDICVSSFKNYVFISFPHFSTGLFI